MNIIVIDYTVISDKELKLICDKFSLSYHQLISDRKSYKLKKVFIDTVNTKLIAYTTKKDPMSVKFTNGVESVFLSLPVFKIEDEFPKIDIPVVKLEVDAILDKISKYGINSLVKEEKDFLDSCSQE